MQVVKRNGKKEEIKFDKVVMRVKALSKDLSIEPTMLAQKVVGGIYDNISTYDIDNLLSRTAAVMADIHPDYLKLAVRVEVSSLHKETDEFYQTMKKLYKAGYLSDSFIDDIKKIGQEEIQEIIDYNRDYNFDYFGFKTLEKSYLLKLNGKPIERPQHMFMRVAIGICGADIKEVKELYNAMSLGFYTHATPTLFNAGTKRPQMSSCFLVGMEDDSIEGIFNTLKECALISKSAGGIGMHIHNIRALGSPILGTNGTSNGIIPMLRVWNSTMRYVDQGGGRRKGSCAVYMEPWHADIEDFLTLKKKDGDEEMRTRDLFLALWVPDLFMKRVKEDGNWTLMCPTKAVGLADVWGEEFNEKYEAYEKQGHGRTIKARDLFTKILEAQAETGVPYILFKDACNAKSNQQNLGTIKSSNLCTEIVEYSDKDETAVCNLASMSLPKFVEKKDNIPSFNFTKFGKYVQIAVKNLNRVIDRNYYPTPKTKRSNFRHRPISLGIQGLADVFMLMGLPFESAEAQLLNKQIAAAMYYNSVEASIDLAEVDGAYETFEGSPTSEGKFQFDLWNVAPLTDLPGDITLDWDTLRKRMVKIGLRNSLLVGLMPTASTSQIFGNFESFDPMESNLFVRETLAGDFLVINKHLVHDLAKLDLWNGSIRDKIVAENGSVQNIPEIPTELKERYKRAIEIHQRAIIEMSLGRAHYVCQAQSMNLFFNEPNFAKMSSALMFAYENGSKNGVYYMRTKPAKNAVKISTANHSADIKKISQEAVVCSLDNPEACEVCSS